MENLITYKTSKLPLYLDSIIELLDILFGIKPIYLTIFGANVIPCDR